MIWRQASFRLMKVKCPVAHGWYPCNQVDWVLEAYLTDVGELLVEVPDNECSLGSNVEIDTELIDIRILRR